MSDFQHLTCSILQTRPFIKKFRGSDGLRVLEVRGIKNLGSLMKLKQGLVKEGGQFVCHADLPHTQNSRLGAWTRWSDPQNTWGS